MIIWPRDTRTCHDRGDLQRAMVTLVGAPMMGLGACADVGRRTGMYCTLPPSHSAHLRTRPYPTRSITTQAGTTRAVKPRLMMHFFSSVMVAVFLLALSRYFLLADGEAKRSGVWTLPTLFCFPLCTSTNIHRAHRSRIAVWPMSFI
jgi:hypothetical protein